MSHKRPQRFPRVASRVILNPRGTNGSGKSTVVFSLLKAFRHEKILDREGKVLGYKVYCHPPMYIIGNYSTVTGGCDTVKTMDIVCDRIRKFIKKGDVLFEGLLPSGIWGRWAALEKELPQAKFIYGVMDTPLETCIERVKSRRKAVGNKKPYDPKYLFTKAKSVASSRIALLKAGSDVRYVPNEKSMETFLKWRSEARPRFPRQ